jgi:glycosyltransferase involved in cell wall biosynthesis
MEMTPPIQLSIITITRDDPAGLERTLRSIAAWRAHPGIEHLVVYAGGIAPATGTADVRWLAQQSRGIAGAFNEGISAAKGEWLWFINGGDALHEGLELSWLRTLLENTSAALVTGQIHVDGEMHPAALPSVQEQWPLHRSWLPHPATLIRAEVLREAGGFDHAWKIAMDYDLWFRLLLREERIDVINLPLARFDPNGISNRPDTRKRLLKENAAIMRKYQGLICMAGCRKFRRWGGVYWKAFKALWR